MLTSRLSTGTCFRVFSFTYQVFAPSFEKITENVLLAKKALKAQRLPENGNADSKITTSWEWAWIDTCCIDKRSSSELSEAINSMYRWYSEAQVCYAYLEDLFQELHLEASVTDGRERKREKGGHRTFRQSRWFTRGWTLQELLAPQSVIFYDQNWTEIGSKSSLLNQVSQASGIAIGFLESPHTASIAQKMSWASRRQTTRTEDTAYCLLGLFGVNMPLLYGEGSKAFRRLQEEIIKSSTDQSIFAWRDPRCVPHWKPVRATFTGMLAMSPEYYSTSSDIITASLPGKQSTPYSVNNLGVSMELYYI